MRSAHRPFSLVSQVVSPLASPQGLLVLRTLAVALAYYGAGRLGLSIPYVGSHVSLVWLPSGIAIAACWRWGRSMAIGVGAAAFAVNYQIGGPAWMGLGIAVGNAIGPLLATALMRRWRFDAGATRRRDLAVILAAIGLGLTVTATNGVAWLGMGGLLGPVDWPFAWITWWTGDSVGALLGGIPLITLTRANLVETFAGQAGRVNLVLLGAVLVCGLLGFASGTALSLAMYFPLLSLPLFLTAILAMRAGVFGASVAVLVLSGTAAWGTATGIGPFAGHDTHAGLFALWSYITTQVCTSVLVFGLAAQLLATRRQHAALFNRAIEAIIVVSAEGTLVDANPAARKLFQLPPGWTPGQPLSSLPDGAGANLMDLHMLRAWPGSGEGEAHCLQLRRSDGSRLELDVLLAHHLDARGQPQTQIMLRDVTERRAAQAQLADSERRLREIADNAPALISKHDVETRFRFANRAWEDWLGVDPSTLIGRTLLETVGQKEFAAMAPFVEAVLRGESVSFERSSRSGRRWMHVGFVPRRDVDGVVCGFYAFASDITARVFAEEALRRSEERYKAVLADQDEVVCRFDGRGAVTYANDACQRLMGTRDLAAIHWQSVVVPEDLPATLARLKELSPANPVVTTENRVIHPDKGVRWMEFVNHVFHDPDGQVREFQTVGRDVTERKELERRLASTSREQDAMLNTDLVGITKVKHRRVVWKNAAFERMLGYGPDELMGATTRQLYFDEASYEHFGREAYAQIQAGRTYRAQLLLARKDGTPLWVDMSGAPLEDGESVWLMQDITLLKQQQAQVEQIAFFDELTGLPNRVLLRDRLSQMLEGCERMNCLLAVCFVDLDGFKEVNDAYGHDLGDLVLKESARRMQASVRSSDTVARLGGDEFVLALSPVHAKHECEPVLSRALAELCLPIPLGEGREARVSASIGVAFYPGDGNAAEVLIARADEAMYLAKRGGRNRVRLC